MKIFKKLVLAATLAGALAVVVSCGGSSGSSASMPTGLPNTGLPGSGLPGSGLPGTDGSAKSGVCDRLTNSQVAEVIGPNDGGNQDYVFGGCVWLATSTTKEGFREAIYAAVLPKAQYQSVAETGEPVSRFVDGATYSNTHGELWFPCRNGDFCGIKVRTASSGKREEIAVRLGKLLQSRV